MDYKMLPEHMDLVKEQVWECREDISIYGKLSSFELDYFHRFLPPAKAVHRVFEIGSGLGRGAIQLKNIYPNADFILADRQGRTENLGQFHPEKDEYYNDFELTRTFCSINGLNDIRTFDTELDDWSSIPMVDLISSRCAIGFHVPLERYLDRLLSISHPGTIMIFGTNMHFDYIGQFDDMFSRVQFLKQTENRPEFPVQHWLCLEV